MDALLCENTSMAAGKEVPVGGGTVCCVCDRSLSMRDVSEFYSVTDEQLHGDIYCRACREDHLLLCRECSARYTVDGMCGVCGER